MSYEHLTWVPEGVELLVPRSKTDPYGKGEICPIAYGNTLLCPATALKALKKWLEISRIEEGPVFRAINKHGELSISPLSESSITPPPIKISCPVCWPTTSTAVQRTQSSPRLCNLNQSKGHFLKRITRQGRWRDTKTALNYIEEGTRFQNPVVSDLLNT